MMRPFRIYVGPHVWHIEYVDSMTDPGQTEPDDLKVSIKGNQPDTLIRSTLLHELLHVCTPTGLTVGKKDAEETFITAVEPQLFAVLADHRNRDLVAFIQGTAA